MSSTGMKMELRFSSPFLVYAFIADYSFAGHVWNHTKLM